MTIGEIPQKPSEETNEELGFSHVPLFTSFDISALLWCAIDHGLLA